MNAQKKGLFCVIEGMDGSGKTTLIRTIADWMGGNITAPDEISKDIERIKIRGICFLREPTTLLTGQEIRRRLADESPTDYREWIRLFRADREANLREYVEPALLRGEIIIQDRYFYSTAAYQGAFAVSGPLAVLAEFDDCPRPDLLFYLDINEKIAFDRMSKRAGIRESFERLDQWRKIYDAYIQILPVETVIIDASEPVEVGAVRVINEITRRTEH